MYFSVSYQILRHKEKGIILQFIFLFVNIYTLLGRNLLFEYQTEEFKQEY